jgi:hypothetical protein
MKNAINFIKSVFVITLLFFAVNAPAENSCYVNGEHPDYSTDVFDAYSGRHLYETGSVISYPWPGFNFDGFGNWNVIEASNGVQGVPEIDVTSGTLMSRTNSSGERGWTDSYNFRMIADSGADADGRKISWNDMKIKARFNPKAWMETKDDWQGIHLFVRYQTEYDLYVVSLRKDGSIFIKTKQCGTYIKIASHMAKKLAGEKLVNLAVVHSTPGEPDYSELPLNSWYDLEFTVQGKVATFSINGVKQFNLTRYNGGNVDLSQPFDTSKPLYVIPGGTGGIRVDYTETYIDDWMIE